MKTTAGICSNNARYLSSRSGARASGFLLPIFMETVEDRINGRVGKYFSEVEKDRFRFGNVRQSCIGVSKLALATLRFSNGSRSRRHFFYSRCCMFSGCLPLSVSRSGTILIDGTIVPLPPARLLIERGLREAAQRMNGSAIGLDGSGR